MKRYLSIWFLDWPLDRLRRSRRLQQAMGSDGLAKAPRPFALIEVGANGLRIAAVNAAAQALGVAIGQSFTDAKARAPNLAYEEIDRATDRAALKALGHWMIRWTPLTALQGDDGLMLETTGCDHLYGGEATMIRQLSDKLARSGLKHRIGLAGTPGAAIALASSKAIPQEHAILANGAERAGLADLPVSALRLSPEANTLLRRFGLTRIQQLYGIDRRSIARRFRSKTAADAVLLRLDQALGQILEPQIYLQDPPEYAVRLACPEPLLSPEGIAAGLQKLLPRLHERLALHGLGGRAFIYRAFRADGAVSSIRVNAARPAREPSHIGCLFQEKLARIDPGYGVDLLMLEAHRTSSMSDDAPPLSSDMTAGCTHTNSLANLADRVSAKLGSGAVTIRRHAASHLPEQTEIEAPFEGEFPPPSEGASHLPPRPLFLFRTPEPIEALAQVPDGPPLRFIWRRVARKVVRADGPERIAPEWWRSLAAPASAQSPQGAAKNWLSPKLDPRADAALIQAIRNRLEDGDLEPSRRALPRARDYYRVEDADGRRYWVFREGLYDDGRGGAPEWRLHGLFP